MCLLKQKRRGARDTQPLPQSSAQNYERRGKGPRPWSFPRWLSLSLSFAILSRQPGRPIVTCRSTGLSPISQMTCEVSTGRAQLTCHGLRFTCSLRGFTEWVMAAWPVSRARSQAFGRAVRVTVPLLLSPVPALCECWVGGGVDTTWLASFTLLQKVRVGREIGENYPTNKFQALPSQ
ncbi:hypothetical protein CI102_8468 [Trichoderma harzianum]|nr:hypothetical protein CI102_8468 [Trichoderma harzianum]